MTLRIFTAAWKISWLGTALFVNIVEMFPVNSTYIGAPFFYCYEFVKAVAFFVIGLEIPLAFWPFNSLNRGLGISLLSAAAIEGLQVFVMGHRFAMLELLLKGVLIMSGFTLGLLWRHDEQLSLLGIQLRLIAVQDLKH
jgi:hypothetical protein